MDKDRQIKSVLVGEPGYPPESGRKPIDTQKVVRACDAEDCWKPATQFHGPPDHLIYTCDEHAEAVMLELLKEII